MTERAHVHGCPGGCDEGRECWRINAMSVEEMARRGVRPLGPEQARRLCAFEDDWDDPNIEPPVRCDLCGATIQYGDARLGGAARSGDPWWRCENYDACLRRKEA